MLESLLRCMVVKCAFGFCMCFCCCGLFFEDRGNLSAFLGRRPLQTTHIIITVRTKWLLFVGRNWFGPTAMQPFVHDIDHIFAPVL